MAQSLSQQEALKLNVLLVLEAGALSVFSGKQIYLAAQEGRPRLAE